MLFAPFDVGLIRQIKGGVEVQRKTEHGMHRLRSAFTVRSVRTINQRDGIIRLATRLESSRLRENGRHVNGRPIAASPDSAPWWSSPEPDDVLSGCTEPRRGGVMTPEAGSDCVVVVVVSPHVAPSTARSVSSTALCRRSRFLSGGAHVRPAVVASSLDATVRFLDGDVVVAVASAAGGGNDAPTTCVGTWALRSGDDANVSPQTPQMYGHFCRTTDVRVTQRTLANRCSAWSHVTETLPLTKN